MNHMKRILTLALLATLLLTSCKKDDPITLKGTTYVGQIKQTVHLGDSGDFEDLTFDIDQTVTVSFSDDAHGTLVFTANNFDTDEERDSRYSITYTFDGKQGTMILYEESGEESDSALFTYNADDESILLEVESFKRNYNVDPFYLYRQ